MSITVHADGREDWVAEEYTITTYTINFWSGEVEDKVTVDVEGYSDWTAIDVAVDKGICGEEQVQEKNRVWEVINVANAQAARECGEEYTPYISHRDPVRAENVFPRS